MTNIENYLSIAKRTGYRRMPIHLDLCPLLKARFADYCRETGFSVHKETVNIPDLIPKTASEDTFRTYYSHPFQDGTRIDSYGVAHEPGSAAAYHMTKMYHPLENAESVEEILAYPLPDYIGADASHQQEAVKAAHAEDVVAVGNMQVTVWERSWYLRGMENLMADMLLEDPMAEAILDRITEISVMRAESYARSGVDVLFLGDDIGMQRTIMMSEELYCANLKPRLMRVIRAAKAIRPEIIVFYHSCGFITPIIPHLIDAGVDVLNPVQPECMDFAEIHAEYGTKLSFHGTIGTQTTMPFGTPEEVRRTVYRNLELAGKEGGLFVAPTHKLEPEVPIENIIAYIQACRDFCGESEQPRKGVTVWS